MQSLSVSIKNDGARLMNKEGKYKIISYREWQENYQLSHPNAIASQDKTEVVLSCNNHVGNCGCMTHAQVILHLSDHWPASPEV